MKEYECPICGGTGFHDGKICVCISGLGKDIDDKEMLKGIFGDIFDNGPKKGGKR